MGVNLVFMYSGGSGDFLHPAPDCGFCNHFPFRPAIEDHAFFDVVIPAIFADLPRQILPDDDRSFLPLIPDTNIICFHILNREKG